MRKSEFRLVIVIVILLLILLFASRALGPPACTVERFLFQRHPASATGCRAPDLALCESGDIFDEEILK